MVLWLFLTTLISSSRLLFVFKLNKFKIMQLQDFIGKVVTVDGLSEPVMVQKRTDGTVFYKKLDGSEVSLGRISDSVSATIKLSRVQG